MNFRFAWRSASQACVSGRPETCPAILGHPTKQIVGVPVRPGARPRIGRWRFAVSFSRPTLVSFACFCVQGLFDTRFRVAQNGLNLLRVFQKVAVEPLFWRSVGFSSFSRSFDRYC